MILNFPIGLLLFNLLLIGVNLCLLLAGGLSLNKQELVWFRASQTTDSTEVFTIGTINSILGLMWIAAWVYFLTADWHVFIEEFDFLSLHAISHLFASASMIATGIALTSQWKAIRYIFLISMIFILSAILITVITFGQQKQGIPFFLYLFSTWSLFVGGISTIITFLLIGGQTKNKKSSKKNELFIEKENRL